MKQVNEMSDIEEWSNIKKANILNSLNIVFPEPSEKYTRKEYDALKQVRVTDSICVCLIESKTEQAKEMLFTFVDKGNSRGSERVAVDYTSDSLPAVSKFDLNFIMPALKIIEESSTEENVLLSLKKDYPLTIENENFKIIIAPRVAPNAP